MPPTGWNIGAAVVPSIAGTDRSRLPNPACSSAASSYGIAVAAVGERLVGARRGSRDSPG